MKTPPHEAPSEENSGCMDAENDFDEYFDKNEIEEYLSVVHVRDHETFERGSAASSQ